MLDPALLTAFDELATVLVRINEESDTLNGNISEFEQKLQELNPGIGVWLAPPLLIDNAESTPNNATTVGVDFGFLRYKEKWGLWLRRAYFRRAAKEKPWELVAGMEQKIIPLAEGSRDERIAAVGMFPNLLKVVLRRARERLATLEQANNNQAQAK